MNYLEIYFIIGFLFTMIFEFIFETFNEGKFKYSSFGERIIFFLFWPIILFVVIKELVKNENIF
jgi:hypothetical protein